MLLSLATLSAIVFVIILAPVGVAGVSGSTISVALGNGAIMWIWSIAVSASTIVILASVGIAQGVSSAPESDAMTAQIEALSAQLDALTAQSERKLELEQRAAEMLGDGMTKTDTVAALITAFGNGSSGLSVEDYADAVGCSTSTVRKAQALAGGAE